MNRCCLTVSRSSTGTLSLTSIILIVHVEVPEWQPSAPLRSEALTVSTYWSTDCKETEMSIIVSSYYLNVCVNAEGIISIIPLALNIIIQ